MSVDLREQALARGERRSSLLVYRIVRALLRVVVNPWLRVRSANAEVLDRPGPTILAPVHRSHLDSALIATQTQRRIRALGKESLFTTPGVSYLCAALGAIPVQRGKADRDALMAARSLLERGESMIVFPEGSRGPGGGAVRWRGLVGGTHRGGDRAHRRGRHRGGAAAGSEVPPPVTGGNRSWRPLAAATGS